MRMFPKRYHPPGTSPGTLIEAAPAVPLTMHLIDYSDADFYEKKFATPTMTWIQVHGSVTGAALEEFGEMFSLHALALEDVLNTGQRPKLEEYDEQLFIVVNWPELTDVTALTEQVSLFVGKNFLVSFHAGTQDPFDPVRERLRTHTGRIRTRNSDYLLFALLDVIIDGGFPMLETLGEKIELIEEQLLAAPKRKAFYAA